MPSAIATNPRYKFFDANGNPAADYLLYTYAAGSLTPKTTWANQDQSTANQNPIVLDAVGEAILWLDSSQEYKFVLKTPGGSVINTTDNISGADSGLRAALSGDSGASMVGLGGGRTQDDKNAETISVKDFPFLAKGDGITDDTNAIKAALAAAKALTHGTVIYFPAGNYRITEPLTIDFSYAVLRGATQIGSNSAGNIIGTAIHFDSASGGDILTFHRLDSHQIVGIRVENLSIIGMPSAASNKPNGIYFYDATECVVENCWVKSNIKSAYKINGASCVSLNGIVCSSVAVGLELTIENTTVFPYNSEIWVRNANLFDCSTTHVEVNGFTADLCLRDSWFEHSPIGVKVSPKAGTSMYLENTLMDNVYFFNGTSTPYLNSTFIRVDAPALTAATYLKLNNFYVKNSKTYQYNTNTSLSTIAIILQVAGNTNTATGFSNISVEDCLFYGLNSITTAACVYADSNKISGNLRGSVTGQQGYQTGATVAVVSGSGKFSSLLNSGETVVTTSGFRMSNLESAGANDLDYYAEGIWTPTDGSGAALAFTNTAGNCYYTRVGNVVTASFAITFPTTSSTAVATINGLPFTSKATATSVFGGVLSYTNAGISPHLLVAGNDAKFSLYSNAAAAIQNVALSAKTIRGTVTYLA